MIATTGLELEPSQPAGYSVLFWKGLVVGDGTCLIVGELEACLCCDGVDLSEFIDSRLGHLVSPK